MLATPAQLAGTSVTATVVGEELGPKIRGFTYKNKSNQSTRWGHRQRYSTIAITVDQRRRLTAARASQTTRRDSDVEDQRWRLDPQRTRLERPAPGREGVRRHRGAGRGHPGAPAGHQVPPRPQRGPRAATTPCSPWPTAPCSSPAARAANWSTSSPATDRRARPVAGSRRGPAGTLPGMSAVRRAAADPPRTSEPRPGVRRLCQLPRPGRLPDRRRPPARWRRLFRADGLHKLTEADHASSSSWGWPP